MVDMKNVTPSMDKMLLYRNYIDKSVEIGIADNRKLCGVFYTIDPVTENVIIAHADDSNMSVINSECITYIKLLGDELIKTNFFELPSEHSQNSSMSSDFQSRMEQWLRKHLFNVIVDGDKLKIDETCVIYPPYGPDQCICDDPIRLELIQDIIRQLSVIVSNYETNKDASVPIK